MDAVVDHVQRPVITNPSEWEESYKPLPCLFFGLLIIWVVLVFAWTFNTWTKRQLQTSNLQWMLTAVPVLKSLVLALSFIFWYSCLNSSTCSFWVAFGVFVSRIFFETVCFMAFLLIAHGYCIMHDQLPVTERRSIAGLASLLYLTLTGYKAAVPQFTVLVVLIYGLILYVIMVHIARNLSLLREQLQLIQDEGVHMMHTAVYIKYTMFKRFQRGMLMMVIAEILMHARSDGTANEYWMRLLMRECSEIVIFFYIGWTFRSRELTPFFTVIPTLHSSGQRILPPIYSVEINEKQFNNLNHKEWHIGVPTSICKNGETQRPMLVIVQNPGFSAFAINDEFGKNPKKPEDALSDSPNCQTCPSLAPPATLKGNDSSSSLFDHDGLQLRLRSSGDLSTSTESGSWRDKSGSCERVVKESGRSVDVKEEKSFLNEVIVDVKGLRRNSCLPFENSCSDSRTLHSRSNSSIVLQGLPIHQSGIV
ncbi:uncharacterized protein [Physcomitrium patens]|uniref:Uncharacterized protein n=1 Tax=Physcomitrium patens TaxID=3218 RepID=A0A2K1KLX5_PHYPA|nr:uncharacterized protein LOC112280916 [Physcomitrium patens]XP_024372635.1 uncharacterized protein LOC112280916 [Physcomitrium patens]XP_024372636.1 uncharacterized protein LOC112280916 [Physcomitrium patens]XP_024372637.1 uncharacterized protein LOC112280916 [Physcomitrium patens]XP_024372638.1 uncharacterized protein LOC112280916 [Physcomitrium patens]PNR54771.1 hypothetical protein PHYPA_005664 [Physcomitrium patens]|eukprot:XP_024372633.1 uncharacterized protein LOC112280916 [Physcomitrella patens]